MNEYMIFWEEYHNPLNWGETEQEGIKNLKDSLPAKKIYLDPNENDGWVICECELQTDNLKEAIELAKEHCLDNGVGVFSIYKNNNHSEPVFTEEDL